MYRHKIEQERNAIISRAVVQCNEQQQQQYDSFLMTNALELLLRGFIWTFLLCWHERIGDAKALLRPQNSNFGTLVIRQHRPWWSRHSPRSNTPSTNVIRTATVTMNGFPYQSNDAKPWSPLNASVFAKYIEPSSTTTNLTDVPRIAASVESANTLLNEWMREDPYDQWSTEWKAITYFDDISKSNAPTMDPIPLHGYLIRHAAFHAETYTDGKKSPEGFILFFPTAVGAHDLFLFFKAAQMVNHPALRHCTILITDLFSDPTGWMWDKVQYNDQYNRVRDDLLRHDAAEVEDNNLHDVPFRPLLQHRINAAFAALAQIGTKHGDPVITAALGWCFGGHCVAELARMPQNVSAMITFHGVFSGLLVPPHSSDHHVSHVPPPRRSEILICHGRQDPFVPSEDLENALSLFQHFGHTTSLLQLDANHGFTNPAQVHNNNSAFGYHPESAKKAWHQALALLTRKIGRTTDV